MQGTEFKDRRIKAGYKYRSWAAKPIGVAKDTIKDWELGRRPVPQYAINWLLAVEAKRKGRR